MNKRPLRVCLIATEFKGIGAYGGFGVLTYDIANGLAAKGLDVYVAMPRQDSQAPIERIGEVTIVSYPSSLYVGMKHARAYSGIYSMIDAAIYHSQEAALGTVLAQFALPRRKHLVSLIDPRNFHDWTVEWAHDNHNTGRLRILRWKYGVLRYYIKYQLETGRGTRHADGVYCHTKHIIEKAQKMFHLATRPGFLPSPTHMFDMRSSKAEHPTVCYVGRWDERKRPELFLELAAKCQTVNFLAAGGCLGNQKRDKELRQRFRALKNVEVPGWLGERERAEILDRAWVLVNTSSREGLPVTYLEAGAHKCAILSHCNADDFASSFGFWAQKGDLYDYEQGLKFLLAENRCKVLGERAYNYVRNTHEYSRVIDQHVEIYERILER
jgi:glycosyltransferase involved in cell wall biosynthesis